MLASVGKRDTALAAACGLARAITGRGPDAARHRAGRRLPVALLIAIPFLALAACSDKAARIEPPMAWKAEIKPEALPLVTASIQPESASGAQSKAPLQSKSPTSEPVKSSMPSPQSDARPLKLRKGGGYHKIGKRYQVRGVWYTPRHDEDYEETGIASWYGDGFHAKKTANGEMYDMNALTAAHRTLPLPSLVRVTNVKNGRSVVVRVNDRGPFKKGRIIDVSARAARELQFADKGIAKVHVKYIGPAPLDGNDARERASLASSAR